MRTATEKTGSAKRSTGSARTNRRATRNIGNEIIEGLQQALAFERGQLDVRVVKRPINARTATAAPAPDYKPDEIAEIRRTKLHLSQSVFARVFNVNPETAKSWEQGKAPPTGSAKRLLQIAESHPELFLELVVLKTRQ
jgi:putative transcriptional regulator